MESPERNEGIPTPVDQGSPFFKYLCGLSPIKPARSVHVVQTYAELSLPPPPTVFSSPPNPNKFGGRVKRGLVVSRTASVDNVGLLGSAWGVDKEDHSKHSYIPRNYVETQADTVQPSCHVSSDCSHQNLLCHKLEHEEATGVIGDIPTKFEYGDVTDYLADPPEGGLYGAACSSQFVPKSYLHRPSPDSERYVYPNGDRHNCEAKNEESLSSAEHHDRADSCDDATNGAPRNSATMHRILDSESSYQLSDLAATERRESLASRASVSSSDHEGSGNSGAEKSSGMDQETAAMAFLLVGDGEEGSRNDWVTAHSALAEFSKQQTPDASGVGKDSRAREDFELAASNASMGERSSCADTKELEDRNEVSVSCTVGQRGVRRRCLDFETSVRRKSMGGGGSRKSLAQRSKPVSSAMTSATSIPPSILCERAVATSDATNSAAGTGGSVDHHSNTSSRPEGTTSGSKAFSPGLLRVSRCTFPRSSDLMATDHSGTDPSRVGRASGHPSCSVGIPSGIGLHLNSLTGSISFSPTNREFKQTIGMASAAKGAVASLLGMPGLAGSIENRSEGFGNSMVGMVAGTKNFCMGSTTPNFGTGVVISLMERSRMTLRETLPGTDMPRGLPNTLQSLTVGGTQSLEVHKSSRVNVFDKKFVSGGKKRLLNQDMLQQSSVDFADENDSPRSPKKRRKSPTASGDKFGEGCKRCNCKKSKCLKLYCECFAAGTYCMGSCTCHDCFNKPEHEEMVLSTRQQIESRNPLAFAPKIVHSGDASPKCGQEEVLETPASARHKRGCNCKKSLCLKKYCECYQAGVGCSEGCRCEGCKNMYGRKEATDDPDDKEMTAETLERGSPEDQLELPKPGFRGGEGSMDLRCNNGKDLSPITPSFQYTGQGKTAGRVRSAGKKRSSSPLSLLQSMPKPSRSPATATRSAMEFLSNNSAQQTPDLQHSRSRSSPISTPKLSRVNQLSPRWDGLGDICTLTPLPHPPLRPTPASISTLDRAGASPSFSRQSIEPISSYQPERLDSGLKCLHPGFNPASDHSPLSSSEEHDSQNPSNHPTPCTPCLSSSAFLGKDNMKAGDNRLGHFPSFLCDDDDTPDFLKYGDNVNSPVITKSSSPKQKRVSPPHFEGMRDRSRGDSMVVFDSPARSSPGLRSGRKFILKALPSLPPLMPLTNSSAQGQGGDCKKQV